MNVLPVFEGFWLEYQKVRAVYPGLSFDTFCLFMQAYELRKLRDGDDE